MTEVVGSYEYLSNLKVLLNSVPGVHLAKKKHTASYLLVLVM